ncbi:ATP-dependent sacrificial sulfur transferase LarE [Haloactinopolyspora sp.]|uniref:ATP-dependent sacrificial sulfur transferase LarE n=1 Tax=Haloactinopolyspora sp. TaxID=1966353 RepID=UPI0026334DA1|nr:ATP-dependent sacrificial sulfur transferase LarE [Haloactinopolyspora sp.]
MLSIPSPDLGVAPGRLGVLRDIVAGLDSVVMGLSGGVDSSLLARVCRDVLGPDRSLAVIARSPSLPGGELEAALDVARAIGIQAQVVDTDEVTDSRYAANPRNRCYFCRDELFGRLERVAEERGFATVAYGEIVDDAGDHRPGRAAAIQHGVRAPLREAGLTKADVRELARELELPVWNKPAMACLASRIPYGDPVTPEKLHQIDLAERVLTDLGFQQVRVRHHGDSARIEVAPDDVAAVLERGDEVSAGVRAAGFEHVTVDLDGYRPGSLNTKGARRSLPLV